MRRLDEPDVGLGTTASEGEWCAYIFIRGCDLERYSDASNFNSRRCGHVGIIIDPTAVKESVSEWPDFYFPVWQNILLGVERSATSGAFLSHV